MPEPYRVTHLTYHEVGAHHGMDGLKSGPYTSRELFDGQLERVKDFCEKYDYKLVVINSNIQEFLIASLPRLYFYTNHTYRNVAAILVLQRMFSKFYYASAHNLDCFHCDSGKDSAEYEKWLLPYLSTDNLYFYSANRHWTRMEKVELLADFEPSYDYLTVCLTHPYNCGVCMKCKRTLMNLDVVGSLDHYANSFDIKTYKEVHRAQWLPDMWDRKSRDPLMSEIREYALKNHWADMPHPKLEEISLPTRGKINKVNLREFPSLSARIIKTGLACEVSITGKYYEWYAVETETGDRGYVYGPYVKLYAQEEIE